MITSAGEAYVHPTTQTLELSIKAKVQACAIFSAYISDKTKVFAMK